MSNLYKKYQKSDIQNQDGGYKNSIWFAPVDTFLSVAMPAPGGTPALGDTLRVTSSHTFAAEDGFIPMLCKLHSVTSKGQTVGEDGAQAIEWSFEGVVLGDSGLLQEQLEGILNDNCVFLVKDQDCLNTTGFVQFGDECLTPLIKLEFDGKTTKEGNKEYKITGSIKRHKYFYEGTVTEKP